jgi:hypothetical protein
MLVHSYFTKEWGMGLGDFIRGSLASQQFCFENKLNFQVDLSHHPIGKYIINRCDAPAPSIDSILNLQNIPGQNVRSLKKYLKTNVNLKSLQHNNLHIYTNVWPTFKIHSTVVQSIRNFFEPNEILDAAIKNSCDMHSNYGVIHIRAGDLLSFNAEIGNKVDVSLNELLDDIHPHLNQFIGKNYIVMSDCAELKAAISSRYGFKCMSTKPSHLTLCDDGLDTLVDYFILSRASHIHQFSVHFWGSGFSDSVKWLYGVPVIKHTLTSANQLCKNS